MFPPSVCAVRPRDDAPASVNSTRPFTCVSVGSPGPIAIELFANWKLPPPSPSRARKAAARNGASARASVAAPPVGQPVEDPHRALRDELQELAERPARLAVESRSVRSRYMSAASRRRPICAPSARTRARDLELRPVERHIGGDVGELRPAVGVLERPTGHPAADLELAARRRGTGSRGDRRGAPPRLARRPGLDPVLQPGRDLGVQPGNVPVHLSPSTRASRPVRSTPREPFASPR